MKHLIILFALLLTTGCAALSIKCPVNSLPPSPTHEELIKQEKHNTLNVRLEKAAQKHFGNTLEVLRQQGLSDLYLTLISTTVVDGSSQALGIVEAKLTQGSRKVGYMYFIFLDIENEWEMIDALPIHLPEETKGM